MQTRIILIRHGVTEDNLRGKFQGRSDVGLSEIGKKQSEILAQRLQDEFEIEKIYCSNLKRTIETAMPLLEQRKMNLSINENLREIDFGEWEGKTHEEVAMNDSEYFLNWTQKMLLSKERGAELTIVARERLVKEFSKIIQENKGKTIAIVSHAVSIKLLISYYSGLNLKKITKIPWTDNAGFSVLDFYDRYVMLEKICDSSHLDNSLKPKTYHNFKKLIEMARENLQERYLKAQ